MTEAELIEHAFGELTEEYRDQLLDELKRPALAPSIYGWDVHVPLRIQTIWNRLDLKSRIIAYLAAEEIESRMPD